MAYVIVFPLYRFRKRPRRSGNGCVYGLPSTSRQLQAKPHPRIAETERNFPPAFKLRGDFCRVSELLFTTVWDDRSRGGPRFRIHKVHQRFPRVTPLITSWSIVRRRCAFLLPRMTYVQITCKSDALFSRYYPAGSSTPQMP